MPPPTCQSRVHRDLATGNVIVEGGGRLRVIDLGAAAPTRGSDLTEPGRVVGARRLTVGECGQFVVPGHEFANPPPEAGRIACDHHFQIVGRILVKRVDPAQDTANGEQAMEIMQRLNRETGTAFIFATHDPRVMKFARRVVELRDGQIVGDRVVNGETK